MSLSLDGDTILLTGECRVEDAESLVIFLQGHPGRRVDLSAAGHLHTAVVQVLMAFRPEVAGPAGDAFVETWLMPIIKRQEIQVSE